MAGHNDKNKKGFSGLSDLASEVSGFDEPIKPEPKAEANPSAPKQPPQPQREAAPSEPEEKTTSSPPPIETVSSGKSGGGSGGKWILGIFGVFFVIWLINNSGQSHKKPSYTAPSSSQSYSYPQSTPAPAPVSPSSALTLNTQITNAPQQIQEELGEVPIAADINPEKRRPNAPNDLQLDELNNHDSLSDADQGTKPQLAETANNPSGVSSQESQTQATFQPHRGNPSKSFGRANRRRSVSSPGQPSNDTLMSTEVAQEFFTLGSLKDHVLRVQGAPNKIDIYSTSGYEDWKYGYSSVEISTRNSKVLRWDNRGNLKVKLLPGSKTTSAPYFTRGSHQDDVLRVQGTPDKIDIYSTSGYEDWKYGYSSVEISSRSREVLRWDNRGNLKVKLLPGSKTTSAPYFTRGSHQDDVLRVQGTPDKIDIYSTSGYEDWKYGYSSVEISTRNSKVLRWDNRGNLKVKLLPGSKTTSAPYFTRGSHQDDVLRVQGTPDKIDIYSTSGYEDWKYGYSSVEISTRNSKVLRWDNRGNLKVKLLPGSKTTSAPYFTRGSHQDDVLRVQGTPDKIDIYSTSGYEDWKYGYSSVEISTRNSKVLRWDNRGNLKVK